MAGALPDPARTHIVLIGASSFSMLDPLPAVDGNLAVLANFFREKWRLPGDHCTVLSDPVLPRDVSRVIGKAAREASETLLIYYAGHGLIDPRTGKLHLAIESSDPGSVHDSSVPYDWIRFDVEGSAALRRIVVLDCCYSARAFGVQSPAPALELDGTYLLAAAAETAVALSPPGEPLTAFTGEWMSILQDGIPGGEQLLTLDSIFTRLRTRLVTRERPEPQRLCRNQLGQVAFVRNPAYSPQPDATLKSRDSENARSRITDQAIADLYSSRSLAETLQAVADGIVTSLGYELAAVNLVRPDGDLIVASLAGSSQAEAAMTGRVGSRSSWDHRLSMGEDWDGLRFIPQTEGVFIDDDVPEWLSRDTGKRSKDDWQPQDRLYAPMHTAGFQNDLIGVISVNMPTDRLRPGLQARESLRRYAYHAGIAISNARIRSDMQRTLVRLEREQQALRASEESFRQAFEFAPSGMAIAEIDGDQHGRLLRVNDALCRLLGRSSSMLRRYHLADLVHPDHIEMLLRTPLQGGRTELRLARRDGNYIWVSIRSSVVADADGGPQFTLTHVQEKEEHQSATGLANRGEIFNSRELGESIAYGATADRLTQLTHSDDTKKAERGCVQRLTSKLIQPGSWTSRILRRRSTPP